MSVAVKTRDRIIEVAIKLFNEKGVKAITTNHIADAAGISPGNLYYHYRNKEEIIRAIFTKMETSLDEDRGIVGDVKDPLINLESELQKALKHKWDYRFFYRDLNSLIRNDAALKNVFVAFQKKRLDAIEEGIQNLIKANILKSIGDAEIEFLAKTIWIIAISWLPFLESSGERITVKRVEEGIDIMRNLFKAYYVN